MIKDWIVLSKHKIRLIPAYLAVEALVVSLAINYPSLILRVYAYGKRFNVIYYIIVQQSDLRDSEGLTSYLKSVFIFCPFFPKWRSRSEKDCVIKLSSISQQHLQSSLSISRLRLEEYTFFSELPARTRSIVMMFAHRLRWKTFRKKSKQINAGSSVRFPSLTWRACGALNGCGS